MDKKRGMTGTFLPCLLLMGRGIIDYHLHDIKIKGERDINNKNIEKIEAKCLSRTAIRSIAMGNSQRWYDETVDFASAVNKRGDINFAVYGGDLSNSGLTDEFLWQRDIMNKLNVPYVALIGNHDCLRTGEETFRKILGDTNFSLIAGRVKFACPNTDAVEYNYSDPIPDFNSIEAELTEHLDEFDKMVFCIHARPLCDQFNNNVAKTFQMHIRQFPALQFCTVAHEHRISVSDVFEDGVMYYGSNCMKNRSYLVFTIEPEEYDYEVVEF